MDTKVFLRCGTHLSSRPKMAAANPLRRWWHRRRLRSQYARADGVICISEGVADDVARVTGVPRERIHVVRNPTLTPQFVAQLEETCSHPWFEPGQAPVVLAAGNLAPVKRFDVLLSAVAPLLRELGLRLVILGEGKERESLLRAAERLGIRQLVDLPGFVANVLPYMRRAAIFVHPSEREGYGNVLAEAMACGTPVVATDCPSGPREILAGGRYGPLVPVGDVLALRQAMRDVLSDPLPPEILREAVASSTSENACRGYLQAFGFADSQAVVRARLGAV
jgi:glycosyltransferase involved in cell wall biosynthesis